MMTWQIAAAVAGLGLLAGRGEAQDPQTILIIGRREQSAEARRMDSPTPALFMPQERVQRLGMIPSGQAMRGFPMLSVSGPPGYANDVRFRGLRQGYTQVLIDGEPVPGGARERQFRVDRLPTTLLDSIDVLPVPAADLPAEGIAGTVDLRLQPVPKQTEFLGLLRGGAVRDLPTFGGAAVLGGPAGDLGWLASGSWDRQARWTPQEQKRFNAAGAPTETQDEDNESEIDEWNAAPRLAWDLMPGVRAELDSFLLGMSEDKDRKVKVFNGAGAQTRTDRIDEGRDHEVGRIKVSTSVDVAEAARLTLFALYQRAEEDRPSETRQFDAAGVLTQTQVVELEALEERRKVGLRVEAGVFAAGLEGGRGTREDQAKLVINGVTTPPRPGGSRVELEEDLLAAWAKAPLALGEDHVVVPGLRLQRRDSEIEDDAGVEHDARDSDLLPSLHWLWKAATDTRVRASVARLVRYPDFNNQSPVVELPPANGINTPDITGDPELEPEKAWALELGGEQRLPDGLGFLGANLFYRRVQDVVERVTALEGARYVQRPVNSGDADFYGFTLDARVQVVSGLHVYANWTRLFSETEDVNSGRKRSLREMPDWLANVGFDGRLEALDLVVGAACSLNSGYKNLDPQDFNGRYAETQEDWTGFLDLYVSKDWGSHWVTRLALQNVLTTEKHREATVFNADGSVQERNTRDERSPLMVTLSLEVAF